MDTPDFPRLLRLAQLSSAVYETDHAALAAAVTALGLRLVGVAESADCQAMMVDEAEGQILVIRGTQVADHFSPAELLDDANPFHSDLGAGVRVRAGYWQPLKALWPQIRAMIDPAKPLTVTGHSLGGVRAAIAPALMPPEIVPVVVAFAPPKGGNDRFWNLAYAGRPAPILVGRRDDFALAWAPADRVVCQPGRILHLTGTGWEWVPDWPWDDVSIPAHNVEAYVGDLLDLAL
jgi:hypothetical protein